MSEKASERKVFCQIRVFLATADAPDWTMSGQANSPTAKTPISDRSWRSNIGVADAKLVNR
jgi:hypothetical protein